MTTQVQDPAAALPPPPTDTPEGDVLEGGGDAAAKARKKKSKVKDAGINGGTQAELEGGDDSGGLRQGSSRGVKKKKQTPVADAGAEAAATETPAGIDESEAAGAASEATGPGVDVDGSAGAPRRRRKKADAPEDGAVPAESDCRSLRQDSRGKKGEGAEAGEDKKGKKKRAKNWAAGAAVDAACGVAAGQAPCTGFPIGEEVVVCCASAVLRAGEDLESQEIRQLRKDARCKVLAYGVNETGRRLKVLDLESLQEGWISCVSQSGKLLLELKSRSAARKIVAEGAMPQLAAEEPARPKASGSGGSVHQPSPPKPPSRLLGSEAASSSNPSPPSVPRSAEAPSRMELVRQLFMALDTDSCGRLNCRLLRGYAALCGFNESEEQWCREYDALCKLYGWNPEAGADVREFAQLVDDEDGAAHCTDEELASVLEEVEHYGVPKLSLPDQANGLGVPSGGPPPSISDVSTRCGTGSSSSLASNACSGPRELTASEASRTPPKAAAGRSRLSLASISGVLTSSFAREPVFLPLARPKPSDTE